MKIVHLLDIPWWSGLSSYAFDSIEAHIQCGHEIQLACQKNSIPFKKAKALGWNVIPLGGRSSMQSVQNFFKIKTVISKNNPDLLVTHTGSTHWIAGILSKTMRIPLIRVRATSQTLQVNFLSQKLYRQCHRIIVPSESIKKDCLEKLSNTLKEKFTTLYPPIKMAEINKQELRNASLKVGILARLDAVKGISIFLKAAKEVQQELPNAQFHIAGPEENISWNTLCQEIKNLNLKNCFYHGFLKEEEVFHWMKSCTLGAIASVGSEELSRAALEWMAAGIPLVSTSVGSIPELMQDGVHGFLVPPNDPKNLSLRILQILKSEDLAKTMARQNQEHIRTNFSPQNFQNKWKEILETSLK